ncbi:hypothetical protein Pla52o_49610 [Novipirellula galeiformis]|uniref:Uncharacterized protein n=1 Tax=Novipirellula galeiformis TaxID=2528004 RepID=A0A5C6C2M8_9BACT|nr:hypothetical protein [Novipirellula galeiformis]TWU17746.1 hypothetical protein Pla52o_49610 [Novipirellula galeiformis]
MEDATRPLITAVSHGEKIAIRGNTEWNGSSRRRFAWMNGIQVAEYFSLPSQESGRGLVKPGGGIGRRGGEAVKAESLDSAFPFCRGRFIAAKSLRRGQIDFAAVDR